MISKIETTLRRIGFLGLFFSILKYPLKIVKKLKYKKMLSGDNIQTRFEEIYRNNFWSSVESLSGEGSEVEYTSSIRRWLIENLPKLNIKVFVDAPCGDFNWMKLVLPKLDLNYTGLDIVPSLINKNNEDHGSII